jgi:hypothetical protein
VFGNAYCDSDVFGLFQRFGGPCILHEFPLFLEAIVKRASPLMVHTTTQQAELRDRYGIDAPVLPCCPAELFKDEEITKPARGAARERLGISPGAFLVSTFGAMTRDKGMHTCIAALDLLRSWNLPAELYFVGKATAEAQEISRIASCYAVEQYVHVINVSAGGMKCRDFLIASDAAIQVRGSRLERPAMSLMDCISAGLPSVATRHLAALCDTPAYIRTVPDRFSPLQVAEQLALIWESNSCRDRYACARAAYLEKHNFRSYAQRLMEILGLG